MSLLNSPSLCGRQVTVVGQWWMASLLLAVAAVCPFRHLPASTMLLLASWILLPAAVIDRWRRPTQSPPSGTPLEIPAWTVVVCGGVYSLFAIQAWLPPSNAHWLLAVGAVGLAPALARLSAGQWAPPGWLPWVAGLGAWATVSSFAGSSYASPATAAGFLTVSAWGLALYFGLRGSLKGDESREPSLILGLFVFTTGLNLAREAGFDPAGRLTSLGLSPLLWKGIVNQWTTKFTAHWLLVVSWFALAATGWDRRGSRWRTALVLALGTVTLGLNGSKAAILALVLSAAVATCALRWPRTLRRLLVSGLVVGVLLAPVLAAVPWQLQSIVQSHLPATPPVVRKVESRGGIWEFSRRLIALRPLQGWGFGASATLPGRDLPIADAFGLDSAVAGPRRSSQPAFEGGHPHNAALLTWLDLGLIGALLVAGLLVATGRAIAAVEEHKRIHATLLGLLTVTATFLAFNYPAWEPEVMSILWMSVVLPSAVLSSPVVDRREHLRSGAVVLLILALGCAALAQGRLSRWLTVRDLRGHETVLDPDAERLVAGGEVWDLEYDGDLDAGAELVKSGAGAPTYIRGWAFDPSATRAPKAVLVFVGSRLAAVVWPERPSPGVLARVERKTVRALTAGFLFRAEPDRGDFDAPVTIIVLERGRALAKEVPPLSGASPGRDSLP